jgi:hypothetical protein
VQAPYVIARVFCVDGPHRGIQFLDQRTGRVLSDDPEQHYYRVDDAELITTDFGPCPAAYYDRTEDPPKGPPPRHPR